MGQHSNVVSGGLFIVLEGGEGCGKSTLAQSLYDTLDAEGVRVTLTREPFDTDLRARAIASGPTELTPRARALAFAADRAYHVEKVVQPLLDDNFVVICDRYVESGLAYQVGGDQLSGDMVGGFNEWAVQGLAPDLTLLLMLDPATGLARARARGITNRFEDIDVSFHHRVNAYFIQRAQGRPSWKTLDASKDQANVLSAALAHVAEDCYWYGHLSKEQAAKFVPEGVL